MTAGLCWHLWCWCRRSLSLGAGCPWQRWLGEHRLVAACQALLCASLLEPGPGASPAMRPGLGSHCSMHPLPLQDVLNSKNATIKDLQLQLARVCKVREENGAARFPWLRVGG